MRLPGGSRILRHPLYLDLISSWNIHANCKEATLSSKKGEQRLLVSDKVSSGYANEASGGLKDVPNLKE